MVVIVDYGMGNLKSVKNAADSLGHSVRISGDCRKIAKASKIIFPGVGHFGRAVKELKKRGLFFLLKERIEAGVPFLGICLGMQVLFESSEEAPGIKGLGVIKGTVKRFNDKLLIVPHMGWNKIKINKAKSKIKNGQPLKGIKDGSYFYFVHSYYCQPKETKVILTTTDYGVKFASSINKDNIWAFQFHAEKSQALGLKLFNNFLSLCA
jgi:imidazole glycerol-phosphate synthase subunit HisH